MNAPSAICIGMCLFLFGSALIEIAQGNFITASVLFVVAGLDAFAGLLGV